MSCIWLLLTDQIFIFGPVAVVARFQDGGVSTTQPGFLDVVTGERLFGAAPDLPMDEGFII